MTNDQAKLLLANGVKLSARVSPAPMEPGFCVELRAAGSMDWEPFATTRDPGHARVFRTLDAVWAAVAVRLRTPFAVHRAG